MLNYLPSTAINVNEITPSTDSLMTDQQVSLRSRAISPLVVSTAPDFERERHFLADNVYPVIDEMCLSQGTRFAPIDLNCGIIEEQTENLEFVLTSLDFVRTCAPFFIALLGERYGVHKPPLGTGLTRMTAEATALRSAGSDRSPSSSGGRARLHRRSTLISQAGSTRTCKGLTRGFQRAASSGYKWILNDAYENSSVLELQIVQAAFLNSCEHCFFYFRVPGHVDVLCEGLDDEEKEEVLRLYKSESDFAEMKMRDLKQRIVKRGLSVKHYSTLDDLRDVILDDMASLLRLLPKPTYDLDLPYDMRLREHAVLAESRRQLFVPNSQALNLAKRLKEFALSSSSDGPVATESLQSRMREFYRCDYSKILQRTYDQMAQKSKIDDVEKRICVLTGDRGCGKTALISNWVQHIQKEQSDKVIVEHYIGATIESYDAVKSMERIIRIIHKQFGVHSRESSCATENGDQFYYFVCQAFEAALGLGQVIIVIDGLDAFGQSRHKTVEQIKSMDWLPKQIPPNCRLIFTSIASDLSHKMLDDRSDVLHLTMSGDTTFEEDIFQLEEFTSNEEIVGQLGEEFKQWTLRSSPLAQILLVQENHIVGPTERWEDIRTEILDCQTLRDVVTRLIRRWVTDHSWVKLSQMEQSEKSLEKDETQKKPEWDGWVSDLLSLLVTARQGLKVGIILEALWELGYSREAEVNPFDLYRFLNAASRVVHFVDGVVRFAHLHFKEIFDHLFLGNVTNASVETRCVETVMPSLSDTRHRLHVLLGELFMKNDNINEALYHFDRASEYEKLRNLLTLPKTVTAFFSDEINEGRITPNADYLFYWSCVYKNGFKPLRSLSQHIERILKVEIEVTSEPDPPNVSTGSVVSDEDFLKGTSNRREMNSSRPPSSRPVSSRMSSEESNDAGPEIKVLPGDIPTVVLIKDDCTGQPSRILSFDVDDNGCQSEETVAFGISCGRLLTSLAKLRQSVDVMGATHQIYEETGPAAAEELLRLAKLEMSLAQCCFDLAEEKKCNLWLTCTIRTCETFLIITYREDDKENEEFANERKIVYTLKGRAIALLCEMEMDKCIDQGIEHYLDEMHRCAKSACSCTLRASVCQQKAIYMHKIHEFGAAQENLELSLHLLEKWFGKFHPEVANILILVANLRKDANWREGYDPLLAEALYRRANHIRQEALPNNSIQLASSMTSLGQLLMRETYRSSLNEAHQVLSKALDIRVQRLGPHHDLSQSTLLILRELETQQKRLSRNEWNVPVRSLTTASIGGGGSSIGSRPDSANSLLSLRTRTRPLITVQRSVPSTGTASWIASRSQSPENVVSSSRRLIRPKSAVRRSSARNSQSARSLRDQLPGWAAVSFTDNQTSWLEAKERFLYNTTYFSHSIDPTEYKSSNTRNNTSLLYTMTGPNSSVDSVGLGRPGWEIRQMWERDIQFKSAWYHIPGRSLPASLRKSRQKQ